MATNSGPIPLIGGGTPIDTNGLWLTLDAVSNDEAFLTIHGTTNGVEYQVLSRESLNDTNGWQPEGPMVWGGANTNWTPTTAFENGRTNLFFWAQSQIDTTGTGIPDWWWLKYFGTTAGADAYVDPAGDGWNNLEKFQNGMNPNQFYTPPAPQGVTVSYDPATGMATVSWLASPGPVTSYTINFNGVVTNVSAGTTSFTESFANTPSDIANNGPTVYSTFQVQANYAGGSSPQVSTSLESDYPLVGVIAGSSESAYLTAAASTLPADTTAIRLSRIDIYAESYYGDSSFDTNWDIPVSAFANGLYPIPSFMQAAPVDSYGQSDYRWWVQTVTTNGSASSWAGRGGGYGLSPDGSTTWYEPPFYDGRAQLKQDLVFILRAASQNQAFYFQEWNTNYFYAGAGGNTGYFTYDFGNPANYAWASPYNANGESQVDGSQFFSWDPFEPFDDNYRYENFVFNTANVDGSGAMTTGVVDDNGQLELWDPTYQISYPSTVHQTTNAWLTANQTRWLYSEWEVDNSNVISQNFPTYSMSASARNIYGLPFVSTELAYPTSSGLGTTTLSAGSQVTLSSALSYPEIYLETAQPQFQTVEYDFWNPAASSYQTPPNQDLVPGMSGFSVTNKSRLMILPVGQEATIAGYAKLAVTNGYPGVYAYLGQYFDKAYAVDNNGNVTTNQTGILSPYGDFFPTQPGPAALVTMPDVDTGVCGTCRVYCVSLVLDANHDGVMDTSFGGPDATSASSPTIFWANNNYDRFTLDSDGTNYYDDDVAPSSKDAPCPYTSNTPTPDCNYLDGDGHRVISCERDLEDFARLWVCGVTSNLLAALPAGSTVTLNWGDVGSPHSANPTIDIFTAADPDGGIGYLTNSTIASEQDDSLFSPYIGRLGPGGSLQLNASTFTNNWAGNHFIWCGVSNGVGQLNLTIADGSGNVLAQASQWIEIKDIKQMYERWTVGEQPSVAPLTNAEAASEDLAPYTMPFRYTQPQDTNTPYILYVHGWNMDRYDKDRFAETAFKRLYWQGYQGRFGVFRWPTDYGFTGDSLINVMLNIHNYDNSEFNAWRSAQGLLNKLNDLNAEYPGHVYVLAHSMGNVVTGEALRLAAEDGLGQIVNTYVASQAAIPAHVYDASVTSPYLIDYTYAAHGIPAPGHPNTPNIYGNRLTNTVAAVGRRISFYNINDYALNADAWCFDQELKPDTFVGGYYFYNGSLTDPAPWNNFEFVFTGISPPPPTDLDIVNNLENRYEVLAYAANPYSTALGATPITTFDQIVNLTTVWPVDTSGHNYSDHFWHSAEFRGDCWQEWDYWQTLLRSPVQGFNISN